MSETKTPKPRPPVADEGTMRRIKKLMTLAMDPAATPGESENALRMAQNLMKKYGVTDGKIASSEIDEFVYQSTKAKVPPAWEGALLSQLSLAFGCRNYWSPGVGPKGSREKGHWVVLAHKPKLEMIQYAFDVLRRQLIAARSKHIGTLPEHYTRPRKAAGGDAFGLAFVAALSKKISLYADQDEAITNALDKKITERCGSKTVWYGRLSATNESWMSGAAAGVNANLHRATGGEVRLKLGS